MMKVVDMPVDARRELAARLRKDCVGSTKRLINLLCDRIPGVFEAAHEEAKEAGSRAHDEYMQHWDYRDPDAFEDAESYAIDVYLNLVEEFSALEQAHRNLGAAGLYHLFEQQLVQLLALLQGQLPKKVDLKKADECLIDAGISVPQSLHDGPIDELRLVANAVKHGEGVSSQELRVRRPDFFDTIFGEFEPLAEPMAGQGITLQADRLREYGASIMTYWATVADQVDVPRAPKK